MSASPSTPSVLVTGASGLIGSALLARFARDNISAAALVRRPPRAQNEFYWDPQGKNSLDARLTEASLDAVIHLAGENISGLWTAEKKRRVRESRVNTTANLIRQLLELPTKPALLITASGIGAYGSRGDDVLTEESGYGEGFLADLARNWEGATQSARDAGVRVVNLRIGVVLAREGGFLPQLLPLFRSGLAGKLGSGNQWMSWIAIDDLVSAVLHVMRERSLSGPVNATAPEPVTNAELTKALAQAVHRPAIFSAPAWALRLLPGSMGEEMLLVSQHGIPAKLLASGFRFEYPHLQEALQNLI